MPVVRNSDMGHLPALIGPHAHAEYRTILRQSINRIQNKVRKHLENLTTACFHRELVGELLAQFDALAGEAMGVNTQRGFCDLYQIKGCGITLFAVERKRLAGNFPQAVELRLRHQHVLAYTLRMLRFLPGQIHQVTERLKGIVHLMNDGARHSGRQPPASRFAVETLRQCGAARATLVCAVVFGQEQTHSHHRDQKQTTTTRLPCDNSLPL